MTRVPRPTRIDLRVTHEEKRAIHERAKASGYSASDFLREAGQHGRVQPVPSINLQQWARLAGLVSNLNQLVRHCNTGIVSPELLPTVESVQEQVDIIRKDLITIRGDPK